LFTTNQATLSIPSGLAYDPVGNRLFVGDTGNKRVLVYDVASITNGENAVNVLGQADFVSSVSTTTQSSLSEVNGVAFDQSGNRLFVVDADKNRVMVFDVASITNGEAAIGVIGQPNFTTATAATTAVGMSAPQAVEYDPVGNRLFVGEFSNNRVLVFNVASITNGQSAVNVLGQTLFTTSAAASTASGFTHPDGLAFDATGNRLFVSDIDNNRILVFNVASITNGQSAAFVLGQTNFTANGATITQSSVTHAEDMSYDSTNNRLIVSDSTNNRLMIFDVSTGTITNGENALDVIGQTDADAADMFSPPITYTKNGINDTPSRFRFGYVPGLALDEIYHRLFVVDQSNHRVLVYNLNSNNAPIDFIPDFVLGQPNYSSKAAVTTATGLNNPLSIHYDAVTNRLFVGEKGNHRVVIYDVSTITNGQAAIGVIGQPNFTTATAATTQTGLDQPWGLEYDPIRSYLYVSDEQGGGQFPSRVLVYDLVTITNGEPAINVLGQANFTATVIGVSASATDDLTGLALSDDGNRLFVTDYGNNRVLLFDVTTITNGEDAIAVLGQANFVSNVSARTQTGMSVPYDVALDSIRNRLFVSDLANGRVLVFDVATVTNGEAAINVLGKPDFTTTPTFTEVSQSLIATPSSLEYNASQDGLFLSDSGNTRIMVYSFAGGATVGCFDPSATMITPNGGSVYSAGDHLAVYFGFSGCPTSVRLSFSTDSGMTFNSIATLSSGFERGVYDWTVPDVSTVAGRLKIELLDSSGVMIKSDVSDTDFTVQGSTMVTPLSSVSEIDLLAKYFGEYVPSDISDDLGLVAVDVSSQRCIPHTLLKEWSSRAVYYCGVDSKRYVFLNEKIFKTWFTDFGSVITVSDTLLDSIPIGGNVLYKPHGKLIKLDSDPKVYAVSQNGLLHWVSSEDVAKEGWGDQWVSQIEDIPMDFFVNYLLGEPLS
jgi:DNA-binding beta-propeller fold protein YncE